MILITGASGQVGCAFIRALSKAGIETKAFIHRASNMEKVKEAGAAEVFVGDMSEEKDIREALHGVDPCTIFALPLILKKMKSADR